MVISQKKYVTSRIGKLGPRTGMNEGRELKKGGENNEKIKKTNNNKLRFAAWSV